MLGATLFYELMSPVPKPVAESVERLHVTGNPASRSVSAAVQPQGLGRPFFNPSPAVDLVYGMWVVPKTADTQQVYPPSAIAAAFPNQFSWLRMYFHGSVQTLCVVATADAPPGNQLRIQNAGLSYAIYLVDTTDPNASPARVRTSTGIKAIRLKT